MGCTVSKDRAIKQRQQNAKSKEKLDEKDSSSHQPSEKQGKTLAIKPSDTNAVNKIQKTQSESAPVKRMTKRLETTTIPSTNKKVPIEVEKKSVSTAELPSVTRKITVIPKPPANDPHLVKMPAELCEKTQRKEGKEHVNVESADKKEEQSRRDADEAKMIEEDSPPKHAERERRERSIEITRYETTSEKQRPERVEELQRKEKSPEKQTEPGDLRAARSEFPVRDDKKMADSVYVTQSIDKQKERHGEQIESQRHRSSKRFKTLEKACAREHEPSQRRRDLQGEDRPSYRNTNANAEMERERLERDIKERIKKRQRMRASQPYDPEDDTLFEVPRRMPIVDFT